MSEKEASRNAGAAAASQNRPAPKPTPSTSDTFNKMSKTGWHWFMLSPAVAGPRRGPATILFGIEADMEPHAPNHFPPMTAPPPPAALTRVVRYARGLSLLTVAISAALTAGQLIMPPGLKPSDLIGDFHGRIEAADANAKREAAVELARRQAEEVAREQGKVQMELAILQQQMLTLHESMTAMSDQANVADWVCMFGNVMSGTSNRDARDWGRTMKGACGYSDSVREQQQAQYQALSRKYAALMVRNDELHRQQVEYRAKTK